MKLFLDTADLEQIYKYSTLIFGVTTTPTIIKKSGLTTKDFVAKTRDHFPNLEIHIEAMGNNYESTLNTIKSIVANDWFDHKRIVLKVPITLDNLKAIKKFKTINENVRFNIHMLFSSTQTAIAAGLNPDYITPLMGRLTDRRNEEAGVKEGRDPNINPGRDLIEESGKIVKGFGGKAEIMASSIRTLDDFKDATLAGAGAITIPPKIFDDSLKNDMTIEGIEILRQDEI